MAELYICEPQEAVAPYSVTKGSKTNFFCCTTKKCGAIFGPSPPFVGRQKKRKEKERKEKASLPPMAILARLLDSPPVLRPQLTLAGSKELGRNYVDFAGRVRRGGVFSLANCQLDGWKQYEHLLQLQRNGGRRCL